MAASRSKSAGNPVLPEGLRNFVRKKCFEIIGLSVLGGVLMVALSLATWSIHDPSLNHATDARPANLLGYPGAAVSDLLMQLFGLGAVGLIVPVAAWSVKLMAQRPIGRPRLGMAWRGVCRQMSAASMPEKRVSRECVPRPKRRGRRCPHP